MSLLSFPASVFLASYLPIDHDFCSGSIRPSVAPNERHDPRSHRTRRRSPELLSREGAPCIRGCAQVWGHELILGSRRRVYMHMYHGLCPLLFVSGTHTSFRRRVDVSLSPVARLSLRRSTLMASARRRPPECVLRNSWLPISTGDPGICSGESAPPSSSTSATAHICIANASARLSPCPAGGTLGVHSRASPWRHES
ncbi:hypothetical protein HYPSUDRAFT_662345 [Hypholoma sublateritium FD-334 SS-4]|uniref:Uncharacterized protein n=1 Tax=Hypholoma sublateritium (strain FD-334 SS-4) TaxID=945553 RepID=A0A0D2P0Q5_HYPSF|nr:hypothetical protein HYPSUDRAFT_662345 [Hypholoma sublateritium FD-334 SS-4]